MQGNGNGAVVAKLMAMPLRDGRDAQGVGVFPAYGGAAENNVIYEIAAAQAGTGIS